MSLGVCFHYHKAYFYNHFKCLFMDFYVFLLSCWGSPTDNSLQPFISFQVNNIHVILACYNLFMPLPIQIWGYLSLCTCCFIFSFSYFSFMSTFSHVINFSSMLGIITMLCKNTLCDFWSRFCFQVFPSRQLYFQTLFILPSLVSDSQTMYKAFIVNGLFVTEALDVWLIAVKVLTVFNLKILKLRSPSTHNF